MQRLSFERITETCKTKLDYSTFEFKSDMAYDEEGKRFQLSTAIFDTLPTRLAHAGHRRSTVLNMYLVEYNLPALGCKASKQNLRYFVFQAEPSVSHALDAEMETAREP